MVEKFGGMDTYSCLLMYPCERKHFPHIRITDVHGFEEESCLCGRRSGTLMSILPWVFYIITLSGIQKRDG